MRASKLPFYASSELTVCSKKDRRTHDGEAAPAAGQDSVFLTLR
jgi:hypothetical protein